MDTMLKLSSVKKKMRNKPKGQRLYNFFYGDASLLTPAQISDIERIVDKEYQDTKQFLQEAKNEVV